MKKISVLIIAKNEEDNIVRALDSVRGLDESLVLDSGSTDNTPLLAKKIGARVVTTDWPGYAEQRRRALAQASNEWCLFLDADEELDDELRSALLRFEPETGVSGYYLKRKNDFLGRPLMCHRWANDWQLRVFLRSQASISGSLVHEGVAVSGGTKRFPKGCLRHNTAPTLGRYLGKFNQYTALSAREKARTGRKPSALKLILSPAAEFIKLYFLSGAFLDGWRGWMLSNLSALYKFTTLAKMREITGNNLGPGSGVIPLDNYLEKFNVRTGEEAAKIKGQGRVSSFYGMVVKPNLAFWNDYLLTAGAAKGLDGLISSVLRASFVFVVQIKLWELEHRAFSAKISDFKGPMP